MIEINLEKINNYPFILAIWTDKADFVTEIKNTEKLLEVHAFDEESEYRAFRSYVDDDFKIREMTDDGKNYFDEHHYIDIDSKQSNSEIFRATGGGSFHLPEKIKESDKHLLIVRFYYEADDEGVNRKTDFRLAGFTNKEKEQNYGNT